MIVDASMQLIGWAATKATEAVVDRVATRAARQARARVAARARKFVSEKRQLLPGRIDR